MEVIWQSCAASIFFLLSNCFCFSRFCKLRKVWSRKRNVGKNLRGGSLCCCTFTKLKHRFYRESVKHKLHHCRQLLSKLFSFAMFLLLPSLFHLFLSPDIIFSEEIKLVLMLFRKKEEKKKKIILFSERYLRKRNARIMIGKMDFFLAYTKSSDIFKKVGRVISAKKLFRIVRNQQH